MYAALAISSGVAAQNAAHHAAQANAGTAGLSGIFGGSLASTTAAGWGGADQIGVWRLAVAAMLLLGARRLAELCYEGLARASGSIFPRPPRHLLGQIITLPAGERIVVIAVTVVFFGPRLTFGVLLAWGAVAAGYLLAGQLAGEGVFLAGLGFARHVWRPVIFALLAAVVLRHADIAYRARAGRGVPDDKYG